jgi:hypothetical protein
MDINLDVNECGLLISAIHGSTLQGKDVHFVSNTLRKLETHYAELSSVPPPPPLQK